jgi:hypothetical protein
MEVLDKIPLELLKGIFGDTEQSDLFRIGFAILIWRELKGIRKGLEAVVKRVDNHEGRLTNLEKE